MTPKITRFRKGSAQTRFFGLANGVHFTHYQDRRAEDDAEERDRADD